MENRSLLDLATNLAGFESSQTAPMIGFPSSPRIAVSFFLSSPIRSDLLATAFPLISPDMLDSTLPSSTQPLLPFVPEICLVDPSAAPFSSQQLHENSVSLPSTATQAADLDLLVWVAHEMCGQDMDKENSSTSSIVINTSSSHNSQQSPESGSEAATFHNSLSAENDRYSPKTVIGEGKDRSALCELCPTPAFYLLTNSRYWAHMQFKHGINCSTGAPFPAPVKIRNASQEKSGEGLCGVCNNWVPVGKARDDQLYGSMWYHHVYSCSRRKASMFKPGHNELQPAQKTSRRRRSAVSNNNANTNSIGTAVISAVNAGDHDDPVFPRARTLDEYDSDDDKENIPPKNDPNARVAPRRRPYYRRSRVQPLQERE